MLTEPHRVVVPASAGLGRVMFGRPEPLKADYERLLAAFMKKPLRSAMAPPILTAEAGPTLRPSGANL